MGAYVLIFRRKMGNSTSSEPDWKVPKSGCHDGFCFSKCKDYYFASPNAWCFTTQGSSTMTSKCNYDSDCEYRPNSCAGSCFENPYSHTEHFSQPNKKVGDPGDELT